MLTKLRKIQSSDRSVSVWVIALVISMGIVLVLPEPEVSRGLASYLPLHTALEIAAIAVACMVFGIAWVTQKFQPSPKVIILGCGALGMLLLDITHTISYEGMPSFLTPSGPEKAIDFWLAARLIMAITLLLISCTTRKFEQKLAKLSRYFWLAVTLILVALFHFWFLFYPETVPATFTQDEGLTRFKVVFEYVLIGAYFLAGFLLIRQLSHIREFGANWLVAAALTMAMSEFFFTLYANVSDLYNLIGHVYKIFAFSFLYRALFVETVQSPFINMLQLQAKLTATINTLPDLLIEVDSKGNYLDIHSVNPELLPGSPEQLIGNNIKNVMDKQSAIDCMQAIATANEIGQSHGTRIKLNVPSGVRTFELSVSRKADQLGKANTFLILSRDITNSLKNEERIAHEAKLNKLLLELQNHLHIGGEKYFMQHSVDIAENLTDSSIAFIHFIDETQKIIKIVTWSTNTLTHHCTANFESHYPIDQAGIWADSIRTKAPVVINDYQASTVKKGLPEGHAYLKRFISLPVIENDKVTMMVGVGNKSTDYTDQDVETLQVLANTIWNLIKQRWQETTIRRLSTGIDQNPYPVLITDTDGKIQYVNHAFTETTGFTEKESLGKSPTDFSAEDNPEKTFRTIWRQLARGEAWRGELISKRKDGSHYTEFAMIYPVRNKQGKIINYVAHKEDITLKKIAEEKIHQLSNYDQLTGFLKREMLEERLQQLLDDNFKQKQPMTVLWLDLDNFKTINDSLGHQVGDLVLVEIANRLRFDLGKQSIISRIAGDSFAAILPATNEHSAALIAEKLLEDVQRKIKFNSHALSVSTSIGLALSPNDGQTATKLMMRAEAAMYRAKQDGRNSFRFFAQEMQEHSLRSLQLSAALKEALANDQFHLVYQPQLNLIDNSMIGAEALLRWEHPEWGTVSPAEFIPLAEQNGLIVQIGEWVLHQVAMQQKQWVSKGFPEIIIAINISALQFHQQNLVERVTQIVAEAGVSPGNIEIELTEAVALKDPEVAGKTINALSQQGFKVSIDDFGTGYSSMSYLKKFAVNKLKIDQSFIKDIVTDIDDQAIVTAIIQMAHSLHKTTIAEGVETQEQLDFLREKGCEEIQGYWYSRPLVTEQFEAFLSANKSNQKKDSLIP
ncbi:EAL domain-containing protein [Kangiella sp.]|uniref:EAL domain-containing protein n=1 Tax=Kangiella sp. TaxID=1920245 RepID=UPI0019A875D6|nr:EAL domain-containing protein [Kangiella sp.]MBD3652848.1 EAL domain-containing protein [Kangiella sp.]